MIRLSQIRHVDIKNAHYVGNLLEIATPFSPLLATVAFVPHHNNNLLVLHLFNKSPSLYIENKRASTCMYLYDSYAPATFDKQIIIFHTTLRNNVYAQKREIYSLYARKQQLVPVILKIDDDFHAPTDRQTLT